MSDDSRQAQGLIPYERWTDEALREVVARALDLAATKGLPGEHHYYITFRTDHPGTKVPGHLKAKYPQEMTVVLQHQFEALIIDRAAQYFSVRLYFGGVASTLVVPFGALTGFADPSVQFGLRFEPIMEPAVAKGPRAIAPVEAPAAEVASAEPPPAATPSPAPSPDAPAQVVSLDAFRRRPARD